VTTVRVDDYSTMTGLRVRIGSEATGTKVQLTGEEWESLVAKIKEGVFDDMAKRPWEPFIYTW
jgi:hypothetical protein